MCVYLLAGELAEDGGDVGGVGGHEAADGTLHLVRHSTAALGNQLLHVSNKISVTARSFSSCQTDTKKGPQITNDANIPSSVVNNPTNADEIPVESRKELHESVHDTVKAGLQSGHTKEHKAGLQSGHTKEHKAGLQLVIQRNTKLAFSLVTQSNISLRS